LHAHLNPNGILAFSLYGEDNLREIRALTGMGLQYKSLEQLNEVVAEKFHIRAAEQALETLWFPDPMAVLQHLRATGVNSIDQRAWTRKRVNAFISDYKQRFSGEQGVPLTYHPLFIVARPKQ
jgi:hypothetical protein